MITLRGMTWNHPRGVLPLQAASAEFKQQHPDVDIIWDARSLHDFEAFPLDQLAEKYDLLMIDHPHIGSAVEQGVLVPLNDGLSPEVLEEQRLNSVGPSYESYTYGGQQWALAADAAAQVSAYRHDLMQSYDLQVPKTWMDVRRLIRELPSDLQIGLPMVPVHAFASFVTISAQLSESAFWNDGTALSLEIGAESLALLQELLPHLHPSSLAHDPIGISDCMSSSNEIVYVPLMYGYSNYARDGFSAQTIHYTDIPSDDGIPRGSMLGGVGIAVSNRCRHLPLAMEFIQLVSGAAFQKGAYTTSGGQPGHRSAWTDEEVNQLTNGFFKNTLRTLDLAYVRPRFDGYITFQEQAGVRIREFVINREKHSQQCIQELNEMLKTLVRSEVGSGPSGE